MSCGLTNNGQENFELTFGKDLQTVVKEDVGCLGAVLVIIHVQDDTLDIAWSGRG